MVGRRHGRCQAGLAAGMAGCGLGELQAGGLRAGGRCGGRLAWLVAGAATSGVAGHRQGRWPRVCQAASGGPGCNRVSRAVTMGARLRPCGPGCNRGGQAATISATPPLFQPGGAGHHPCRWSAGYHPHSVLSEVINVCIVGRGSSPVVGRLAPLRVAGSHPCRRLAGYHPCRWQAGLPPLRVAGWLLPLQVVAWLPPLQVADYHPCRWLIGYLP